MTDDLELVRLSREGDLDSFNQLVQAYQRTLYNMAYRMLGDRQAAEDACQDTFIAAWRALGSFRGGNFKSWIFHIAANMCRDELRRRKSRPVTSMDGGILEAISSIPSESPDDFAEKQELARTIQEGLAELNTEQRLAVVLSDLQGLSYEEIAAAMKCSIGTVRSRLSRGRARLRDYLVKKGTICY